MKKLTLFLFISFGLYNSLLAQNWEFKLANTNTIVTNTIQDYGIYNTQPVTLDIDIKNVSSDTLAVVMSRKIIIAPSTEWGEQLSYGNASGGTTHDLESTGSNWTSSYFHALPPNDFMLSTIKIYPDPALAPATYRYFVGLQGDLYQDSIDMVFTSTLNVKENEKEASLSIAPNPANENVTISVLNFEKGNLKIVDVLGNVVKSTTFDGSKTLNIGEFRNGLYFILISEQGMQAINRKLVVSH